MFEDVENYDENIGLSNFDYSNYADIEEIGLIFNRKKKPKNKVKKPPGEPKDHFDEALNYHEWYLEEQRLLREEAAKLWETEEGWGKYPRKLLDKFMGYNPVVRSN